MKIRRICIVVSVLAAAMVPSLSHAARDRLAGYGNAQFGMTLGEVMAKLDGNGAQTGNQVRAPAAFEINGSRPAILYTFDRNGRLGKVLVQNSKPAVFLECLVSFQLYLQFVSAEHGKADYLFQDSEDGIHAWRAMFLFEGGGAVHLNVNFGTEDLCSVEVGYLPAPEKTQMVTQ
jgi:hypothetical protein